MAPRQNAGFFLGYGAAPIPFGLPLFGRDSRVFFVDYTNGLDGNPGTSVLKPLKTLDRLHDLMTAGRNDVGFILGDGSTTATQRLSESLTWSKNACHLIGVTAPNMVAHRARISHLTTATTNINPLMTVSASGCIFANFSYFQGIGQASTDEQLLVVSGSRNWFWNVHFGGMGHANGAARAGSYVLGLSGGENLFEKCTIGLETTARSAANASVVLQGSSAQRNKFLDCDFQMYPTANSPLFLDAATAGVLNGSTMHFKNCSFRTLMNASGSTQPSVNCTVNAAVNGTIYFDRCTTGAAKWAAATAQVKVASGQDEDGFNGGVFASAADS